MKWSFHDIFIAELVLNVTCLIVALMLPIRFILKRSCETRNIENCIVYIITAILHITPIGLSYWSLLSNVAATDIIHTISQQQLFTGYYVCSFLLLYCKCRNIS
eukprot:282985_1